MAISYDLVILLWDENIVVLDYRDFSIHPLNITLKDWEQIQDNSQYRFFVRCLVHKFCLVHGIELSDLITL